MPEVKPLHKPRGDLVLCALDTPLSEINSQCIIQTMEEEEKEKRKERREEKDLVIQGRVSFGPSWFWADYWFWAELVLGRLGLGRVGFGPS